jgi:hypothetical protein
MPLSIATNLASMTAQRSFLNSNADLETALSVFQQGSELTLPVMTPRVLLLVKILSHEYVV